MISALFHTFIYEPFYNGFIFLIKYIPAHDAGLAVIILTILVKLVLFPTALKSIQTQIKMRNIEPRINEIKEKFKDDKAKQATLVMEIYKKENINPLSSFLMLFIQIPVILGLYLMFSREGLLTVNTDLLYVFNTAPASINMIFLGILDISKKSIILAVLAGISQFIQAYLLTPPIKEKQGPTSMKDDLAKNMNLQMKYVFPVLIAFLASRSPAAVALYWTTSNVFSILQELYVRKTSKKQENSTVIATI